jgi:hypothetical protein
LLLSIKPAVIAGTLPRLAVLGIIAVSRLSGLGRRLRSC